MKHGFVKAAALTPGIRVADTGYNAGQIKKNMDEAAEQGAKIIVFPELCITGYTCGGSVPSGNPLRGSKGSAEGYCSPYQGKGRPYICGASSGDGRKAL